MESGQEERGTGARGAGAGDLVVGLDNELAARTPRHERVSTAGTHAPRSTNDVLPRLVLAIIVRVGLG